MNPKGIILGLILGLLSTPALAQKVLCVNDFTGCVNGAIAPGGGGSTGANPTAKVGPTVVNGSATTYMRSDGAPPIDLTANYTWTGLHTWTSLQTFQTDPVISSGGSSTDGAIFFGTNGGSRFISYDHTNNGGVGGYALGNTFGASDTLFTGPIRLGATVGVLITPGASGSWTLTLPTSGGSSGQVLSTNGSGATSWIAAGGTGTVTSVGCGSGLSGGTITTTGTCSVTNPIGAQGSGSGGTYYTLPSGGYMEYGGTAFSGGSVLVTWPHVLSSGVASVTATAVTGGSCVVTVSALNVNNGSFWAGAGCGGSETILWQMFGN